jgi:hypothetical protein
MVTFFNGIIKNYDQITLREVWEHSENNSNRADGGVGSTPEFNRKGENGGGSSSTNMEKLKVTMTVCEYSPLKGYLVVGGVEGMMFFYDMQTKLKI